MGKYYLTKGFSLEIGLQIGFLLSAENNGVDAKDSFKTIDISANFGIVYKFDNGLHLGARYNLSLTDINNLSDKNRNGVFQITVGYFFFK